MIDRVIPKRRRGSRRKGERRVRILSMAELYQLFDCADLDALLPKLEAAGIKAYVSGYGEARFAAVFDYQLSVELREKLDTLGEVRR